jgi:hypothetical protein
MSTYYSFYLARKLKSGMKIVGPAVYNVENEAFKIKPAVCRSRSFINWDEFFDIMDQLSVYEMDQKEDNLGYMAYEYEPGRYHSNTLCCPYQKIVSLAASRGLKVGYAPLKDINYVARKNYKLEDQYEIDFVTADMVAEMPAELRKEYGKVAFYEEDSVAYISAQIVDACGELVDWDKNDYYVVCVVE